MLNAFLVTPTVPACSLARTILINTRFQLSLLSGEQSISAPFCYIPVQGVALQASSRHDARSRYIGAKQLGSGVTLDAGALMLSRAIIADNGDRRLCVGWQQILVYSLHSPVVSVAAQSTGLARVWSLLFSKHPSLGNTPWNKISYSLCLISVSSWNIYQGSLHSFCREHVYVLCRLQLIFI